MSTVVTAAHCFLLFAAPRESGADECSQVGVAEWRAATQKYKARSAQQASSLIRPSGYLQFKISACDSRMNSVRASRTPRPSPAQSCSQGRHKGKAAYLIFAPHSPLSLNAATKGSPRCSCNSSVSYDPLPSFSPASLPSSPHPSRNLTLSRFPSPFPSSTIPP